MCPDETNKRFFHKSLSRDYHFCIDLTPWNLIILSLIDYVLICPIIPWDDFSFIIVHMIKDSIYLRGGSIINPLLNTLKYMKETYTYTDMNTSYTGMLIFV